MTRDLTELGMVKDVTTGFSVSLILPLLLLLDDDDELDDVHHHWALPFDASTPVKNKHMANNNKTFGHDFLPIKILLLLKFIRT